VTEPARKRILFVDDEQAILDGLRNVLRADRQRWRQRFAGSGAEALELLAAEPADVVVSDMRMPAMDGLELLDRVRQGWPEAARVVLSGYADMAAVARASAFSHRHLLKPCDAPVLRGVVARACELQELFGHPSLRRVVGSLGALPSSPRVHRALTEALAGEGATPKGLAAIVESDPGISARLLQFVNSACCGLAHDVVSIEQAIDYAGIDNLRHLAPTLEDATPPAASGGPLGLEALGNHARLTARIARALVGDPGQADAAFTAGLLHDAGRLVLAGHLPAAWAEAVERSRASGRPLEEEERASFGASDAEVGAYLLGLWGLPQVIVEAVAFHHDDERVAAGSPLVAAVGRADLLAQAVAPVAGGPRPERLAQVCGERAGEWMALAEREAAWLAAHGGGP
jgi:HD-like signal output (HDOD) protein/ActR/RegA family two-component response regulator